ncbi:MAG: Ig-like domain-containing protein, partial [Clostridia bacterium]|nr:Ig-like domain-containing protein [Clostridia bacterium]
KVDNFILASGDKLYLNAILSDTFASDKKRANISWTSDVPAVASVDENGVVLGEKSGIATITATDNESGQSASVVLRVEKKVITLLLETTTKSLEVGLAKETVFASKEYADKANPSKDNLVNNTFSVEFLRPYIESEDMYDAFNFEVYENDELSDKAHFENNVLVFDRENITEKTKLTLKISAKFPKYKAYEENTTCYVDLYVTDAVGINSCKEFEQAGKDGFAACLERNIQLFDGAETTTNDSTVIMKDDVYGNGFMFSAYKQQITSSMILVRASNVTVSNIIIRANEVGEEISTADEAQGLKGTCVAFDPSSYAVRYENCRVEYSICENASSCIRSISSDVEIEGCIIRNAQGTGIYVPTRRNCDDDGDGVIDYTKIQYSHITIKNCVMSNLIGTGFSFFYDKYSDSEEKLKYVENDIAEGRNTTLSQEGFL